MLRFIHLVSGRWVVSAYVGAIAIWLRGMDAGSASRFPLQAPQPSSLAGVERLPLETDRLQFSFPVQLRSEKAPLLGTHLAVRAQRWQSGQGGGNASEDTCASIAART